MSEEMEIFSVVAYSTDDDGYGIDVRVPSNVPYDIFDKILSDIVKNYGVLPPPTFVDEK